MNIKHLKETLAAEYPYRIELHAHTNPASKCSQVTPQLMAETYKGLGFDGLVLTNHFLLKEDMSKAEYMDFYMADYEKTREAGERLGLKVYLGTEIRFTENYNEFLIFGVTRSMLEDIYDLLPYGVENFRAQYRLPDSVFVQAHPMRKNSTPVAPELLDGVEVFNTHPLHDGRIGLAALYAQENKREIITAGSDFHHPDRNHEGLSAMRTQSLPEDSFGLAAILKEKNYLLEVGRGTIIIP
jgi:hypothetical protein